MNKTIFHLILVSLMFNIAAGILMVAVDNVSGQQVFSQQDFGKIPVYNANQLDFFETQGRGQINAGASATDSGNLVFRLLDLIGLGFISKIIAILDHYMYGFVNILNSLFGQFLNPNLYYTLFGIDVFVSPTNYVPISGLLKLIVTIGYILGAFELWSNKSVTD